MKSQYISLKTILILTSISLLVANQAESNQPPISQGAGNFNGPNKHHSLFVDNDNVNKKGALFSKQITNIPIPQTMYQNQNTGQQTYQEEEKNVANRITDHYSKIFEFLDVNGDGVITAAELVICYTTFNWPKSPNGSVDNNMYSKSIIGQFDKDGKGGLNFVEFCEFMQSLFTVADQLEEEKCNKNYDKAVSVLSGFFKWLDRDNQGVIGFNEMKYGISRMMGKDADDDQINRVIKQRGNNGKIDSNAFLLAIANGELTYEDTDQTQ